MLSTTKIINIEEVKQSKQKTCEYKGVTYFVQRDKELSDIHVLIDGKQVLKRQHRYYIVVDREKLYLDFDGNKVCNKQPGNSSEVKFLTPEEVELMKIAFIQAIENATTTTNKLIAYKNYCMFNCGIYIGLRASDFCKLQWKHLYDSKGDRIYDYWFKAKKTKKATVIKFNDSFFEVIEAYMKKLIELKGKPHKEDYIFFSKKNDKQHITETTMWNILSETAKKAGIEKNVGSHSLRKTFGRNTYNNAIDKEAALIMLCDIFKHRDISITRRYIGITIEMKRELFDSINGIFGEVLI